MKLRIATRRSQLALTQTRWVAACIREHHPEVQIEEVRVETKGDRIQDRPLTAVGGKGLFVAEVEAVLVAGDADLAVHSLKDVPGDTDLAEGFDIVCVPPREDPRDLLLTGDGSELDALEAGTRVGTTSLRRVCQLRARRPDLAYATLRGNVDTRLRKLDEGQYGAIVLAAAGLRRLGLLSGRPHWPIPPEVCLPAVGQGTLAIEGRADDARLRHLLAPLEHPPSRIVTEAERTMLRRLQGSCRVPIGGHARRSRDDQRLSLEGLVGSLDGDQMLQAGSERYLTGRRHEDHVAAARELGDEVAEQLIGRGARRLMREAEAAVMRSERHGNGGGKWS
ncbi:MAG: hydroxymethylbilane synthase [Myxococcota bacterium]